MRQIVICWAMGIGACQLLSELPSVSWLFLSLHCFLLILSQNKYLKSIGWIGLGFFYAMGTAHNILNHRLPIDLEGKLIEVHGRITNIPQYTDYGARFEFNIDDPALQARLTWIHPPSTLQTNQRYKLKVRLKQAHGLRNPNTFDQERWFFQHRIRAQGTVKSGELVEDNFNLRFQIYQFLKEKMQDLPRSGILIALLLGETNGISQHEWKILKNTGTIHLISVSGTHLTLMAFFSAFIITLIVRIIGGNWLLKINAHILIALLSFIIVALYAWLSGFSIPTQRSLIMIGTVLLGIIFNHRFSTSYILSAALFLVLLFDPLAILSIGFWLSFGAITILLSISLNHRTFAFEKLFNYRGNIAIFIGLTMPLILFFGQLPLLSIPANLIAVFLIGFLVMPLLFIGAILLPFGVGYYLLLLSSYVLEITMLYLEMLATLDFSLIYLPNAPLWALSLAMIGTFFILMPKGMVGKWISLAWFLPMLFPPMQKLKEREIYFDLLDVGQGLSAVIRTKNHVLIYDTAPAFEQKVVAESTLIPFLRGKGVQDISRLIISHPHFDHAGGVKSLMQTFEINDILTTEPKRWKNASYCKAGQLWEWDGVIFEMLAGEENYYKNNSCVLKVTTGKHAILLTGDIEREQELKLAYEKDIKANILIAPHHGSKTSSSWTFVNAVKPDYVLFSVGYKNQFKHPRSEIIQRYQMIGAQTLETQHSGTISFQITPEMISPPQRYREINRRYWHH